MKLNNFLRDKRTMQAGGEAPAGAAVATEAPDAPAQEQAAAPDFSFIPEDFREGGNLNLEKFKAHYEGLAPKAEVPDAYDFTVPADLKIEGIPEGMSFAVDPAANEPLFAELNATLKELGAPKEAGSKIGALLAKYEAGKFAAQVAEQRAEFATLGTEAVATARLETVQRVLETSLPAEEAAALMGITKSAKALIGLEKLIGGKGLTSPTPLPSTAANEALTPLERLKLANSRTV